LSEYQFVCIPGHVSEALPPPAADHLETLRQDAATAHAVVLSVDERLRDEQRSKFDAEVRREQLIGVYRLKSDDPRILELDKKLHRLVAAIERLTKEHERYQNGWREGRGLVDAIDRYSRSLPSGSKLSAYLGPAPELQKGENYAQAVERCRRRLRELAADMKKYATAAIPSSRAKQIIRAEIERCAENGRPNVTPVVDHGEPIRWPMAEINRFGGQRLGSSIGQAETFDGLAVLTWLFKPQLIDALEKEIDAIADDTAALSDADRAKLMAEVERDMLAVEREEEFFIRRAREDGVTVTRRRDANPLAVLQLSLVSI
jgi:hypothetical protein